MLSKMNLLLLIVFFVISAKQLFGQVDSNYFYEIKPYNFRFTSKFKYSDSSIKGKAILYLHAVDSRNNPIGNAQITISDELNKLTKKTDSLGICHFILLPGSYEIAAKIDGYGSIKNSNFTIQNNNVCYALYIFGDRYFNRITRIQSSRKLSKRELQRLTKDIQNNKPNSLLIDNICKVIM